jgi:DNA-binding NarL/FixJ family response regulator
MTIRVLVADDQAPFRRAARGVLTATAGFQRVGEATSGEEAVALVGSLRPDLVLMDIKMAGIGGIEAARSITATYPETMTILLSTYREEDLPPEARTCGASAYLHKSELGGRMLRELWDGRRYARSAR